MWRHRQHPTYIVKYSRMFFQRSEVIHTTSSSFCCAQDYKSMNNILFKTWIIDAEWSVIDGIRQLIYVDQYYYWYSIFSSYLFLIESSQSHPSYSKDSRITQCYFMTQCYVTFYHSNVMTNIKCYEHGRVMIFLSCTNVLFGDIYLKYCLESCNNWRVVLQIQQ